MLSACMVLDAWYETGRIWLVRPVPGDPQRSQEAWPLRQDPGPGTAGLPEACDTPGRIRGNCRSRRYEWSWPEPPAGVTPHHSRSRWVPSKTGACGQPGSRTA